MPRRWTILVNEAAQAHSGDGGGLAGHRPRQALALQRRGEVSNRAGKKAGEEFHGTISIGCSAQTGRLRKMEWGSS